MNSWIVEGANQLNQQWFWFRVGNGPQLSLDTLGAPTVVQTANTLDLTYTSGSSFTIETKFTLTGGSVGSGMSGMGEQIKISNISGGALDFHFFEYADFNLPGNVQLGKDVTDTLFNEALVTSGNIQLDEDIDTGAAPGANRGEAALYNSTLTSLTTTSGYNLNDNLAAGSGLDHVTWALQWDTNFTGNGSFTISKVLSIEGVPEPPAWSLLSMGVLAFGVFSHFRYRRK